MRCCSVIDLRTWASALTVRVRFPENNPLVVTTYSSARPYTTPPLRWLMLGFCLSTAVAFGVHIHLVPILLDRGYSPTLAATLAGLVGAMQVFGRILMGPLAGRLPLRTLTASVLALQPVALLVLLLVPGLVGVAAFVALFGAAKGCLTLVRPALVADLYGTTNYASISGVLAFAVTLAQAGAPVGAGAAYDAFGGYQPILWASVVVSAAASICLLPTRHESRAPARGHSAKTSGTA